MATRIVDPWTPGTETGIRDWFDRLEEIFQLEGELNELEIAEDANAGQKKTAEDHNTKVRRKKMGMTIAYIGGHGYQALKTIAAPSSPKELSYSQAKERLIQYIDPPPSPLGERYLFYRLKQGMKTCFEWRQALLTAATHCQFDQQHLKSAIRDQFIFGLANGDIRETLMGKTSNSPWIRRSKKLDRRKLQRKTIKWSWSRKQ